MTGQQQATTLMIMNKVLEMQDLRDVQDALWPARTAWRNIGIRLKLPIHDLDAIDEEGGKPGEKFTRMLTTCLKRLEPLTWKDLKDVLNHQTVGMGDVAKELQIQDIN
ncbi:hypothetical protein GBAR_LOCUS14288 [Geodia barretti]|uniref:Uncharacterized protein n=1 Tax=Geodia barretti TaxID=519541 RepID=A0AA35WSA0_GEOBA|nr:hypothetical protein GBAR_LOCUS14288 [Geodia barretti]